MMPGDETPAKEMPSDEALPEEPAMEETEAAPKPATGRAKASNDETESAPTVPTDPAVLAVLESHPQTPVQLLRAIDILVDLGHADLAKPFAAELAHRKLEPVAKVELTQRFHSAVLLKLAHDPQLKGVLGPLVDDLLKSAEAYRRDAKRLTAWAQQLGEADDNTRAQAALQLIRAREAAVAPLVAILADPKRRAEQPMARDVLVQLDGYAVGPLLGVLESSDVALKTQVISVLGRLRSPDAVPQLLGPLLSPSSPAQLRAAAAGALAAIEGQTPSPADALRMLELAANDGLLRSRQEGEESHAPAEIWHWNPKKNQSMPIAYDATAAALAQSVRLARELYRLDPNQPDRRRLYLTALLQSAKFRDGLGNPLPTASGTAYAIAAAQGPDVIDDVLADAHAPRATCLPPRRPRRSWVTSATQACSSAAAPVPARWHRLPRARTVGCGLPPSARS